VKELPKAHHSIETNLEKTSVKNRVWLMGGRTTLLDIISRRICPIVVAKHKAKFACQREKIFGERAELKRKTILERKRYNSRMVDRVMITLKHGAKFVLFC
jgi:hypothetical protein